MISTHAPSHIYHHLIWAGQTFRPVALKPIEPSWGLERVSNHVNYRSRLCIGSNQLAQQGCAAESLDTAAATMSSEQELRNEQEVLARYQEMRQIIGMNANKLATLDAGAQNLQQLLFDNHLTAG